MIIPKAPRYPWKFPSFPRMMRVDTAECLMKGVITMSHHEYACAFLNIAEFDLVPFVQRFDSLLLCKPIKKFPSIFFDVPITVRNLINLPCQPFVGIIH